MVFLDSSSLSSGSHQSIRWETGKMNPQPPIVQVADARQPRMRPKGQQACDSKVGLVIGCLVSCVQPNPAIGSTRRTGQIFPSVRSPTSRCGTCLIAGLDSWSYRQAVAAREFSFSLIFDRKFPELRPLDGLTVRPRMIRLAHQGRPGRREPACG